jgi:hypothetical protein
LNHQAHDIIRGRVSLRTGLSAQNAGKPSGKGISS